MHSTVLIPKQDCWADVFADNSTVNNLDSTA